MYPKKSTVGGEDLNLVSLSGLLSSFPLSSDLFSKPGGTVNCGEVRYSLPQYAFQHTQTDAHSFLKGQPYWGKAETYCTACLCGSALEFQRSF